MAVRRHCFAAIPFQEKKETGVLVFFVVLGEKEKDAVAEAEGGAADAAEDANVRHMHNSVGGTALRPRTRVPFFQSLRLF